MIDLEQLITIKLHGRNIIRYEKLGYNINQYKRKNNNYKYTVPNNTYIEVKLKDIPITSNIKIKIQCDYCGKIFYGMYNVYNNYNGKQIINKNACPCCIGLKIKEIPRLNVTIKDLEDLCESKNYKLIIEKIEMPITIKTRIYYICNIHPFYIQNMSYDNLKRDRHCKYCGIETSKLKQKLSYDYVKKAFADRGYILLSTEYKKNNQKLEFICSKHSDKIQKISYSSFQTGCGCILCGFEQNRGENNVNWKGGISSLHDYLRKSINNWKQDSLKQCHYQCVLTKEKSYIVHHLYGFDLILQELIKNIPENKRQIGDFTLQELEELKNNCLKLHYKYGLGICLSKKVHDLFHKKYGKGNNTPEQFEQFKIRYMAGEFDNDLKELNLSPIQSPIQSQAM